MAERQLPPVTENGWRGMVANSRIAVPQGFVSLAKNFYLDDGVWVGRPGMKKLGATLGGGSKIQGLVHFVELDGTSHVLAFANADMYEYDWETDTWDVTDLSAEGIVMDPSSDLSFANSRGRLIVTDGVSQPWMIGEGVAGTQQATPNADLVASSWTPTPLHESIDDMGAGDGNLISFGAPDTADKAAVGLETATDPLVSTGHVIQARVGKFSAGGATYDLTVELRQGYVNEGSLGTLIATLTEPNISDAEQTTYSYTLSGTEADAITDYSDLQLRWWFTDNADGGDRALEVDFLRIELPDADTGGRSFTVLSNAPIARGVVIYYDKVFFFDIPGEENEFEWSNEGDPINGYEPDNQVWEFAQTDAGRIRGMMPFNDALNILKEDSAAMLMGAVDEEFRTNAVREGLSETEGTVALRATAILEGNGYFLSQNGPRVSVSGQRMQSIHETEEDGKDMIRDVLQIIDHSSWEDTISFVDRRRKLVGWIVPTTEHTGLRYAIVFGVDSKAFQVFEWDESFSFSATASVEDPDGDEFVLLGTESGEVYLWGGDSEYNDGSAPIELQIRSREHGVSSPTVTKRMVDSSFLFNLETDVLAEIRPMHDGVTDQGRLFGKKDRTGRFRYRRGMNAIGYTVGWEFFMRQLGMTITLERAVVVNTTVSVHPSW